MAGEPDLIIGIDVGMSCTGIAYLNKSRGTDIVKVFQDWPGRFQENKVPTRLTYDTTNQDGRPLHWGFKCDTDKNHVGDLNVEEWFKINLGRTGENQSHVEKLYTDYMECLYTQLRESLGPSTLHKKTWDTAVIEFVFSIPATWGTELVDVFKNLASAAGFGQCPRHKVTTSLTEPQAVAAYTLSVEREVFKNNDTILVVDAGGGTLDLCLLKIDNINEGKISTTELNPVVGAEVGSTYIDAGFQALTKARLEPLKHLLHYDPEDVAWQMRNSREFHDNKQELGKGRYDRDDRFLIPIAYLQKLVTDDALGVDRGEMVFHWGELESLFEEQVKGIKANMKDLLDNLALGDRQRKLEPGQPVTYIILSGGLGSSAYVQEKIRQYCEAGEHAMLQGTTFLVSTEPQLAVCRGLVDHAKQQISMFPRRCARSSFGLSCRIREGSKAGSKWKTVQELAKEQNRVTVDEYKQKWIPDCMDWFVVKGSRVCDGDRQAYRYHVRYPAGTLPSQRSCRVQIFTCLDNPPPTFRDQGNVRTQAHMEVNLSQLPEKTVDKSVLKKMMGRKPYIEVEFSIEAVIGAAEVSFQCLDNTSKRTKLSRSVNLEMELDGGNQGGVNHGQLSRA